MTTREIDKGDWPTFCAMFSHQHQGWLVGISETAPRGPEGAEGTVLARDVPLEGVSTEPDGEDRVVITVGSGEDRMTHTVHDAVRLVFEQTADDADQGLRVDSASGGATLVRFRTPAHPDVLDGLAESEQ